MPVFRPIAEKMRPPEAPHSGDIWIDPKDTSDRRISIGGLWRPIGVSPVGTVYFTTSTDNPASLAALGFGTWQQLSPNQHFGPVTVYAWERTG